MEEHQNNTDTNVQDTQADSGEGAPKVIKAGSEAKSGRRVARTGASNGGTQAGVATYATGEAARSIPRAEQQALEGARVATYAAAAAASNLADGSDHGATEAAQNILRAGQQALEGAEAAAHATIEDGESVLRAGQQALEGTRVATYAVADAAGESMGVGHVLGEWASCVRRASLRNIHAVGDLMHCYTFQGLLQWQSNLLNATIADLLDTNARILQSVMRKA